MTSPSYPRKLVATVSLATVAFVGISPLLTPTFTVAQAAEDITPPLPVSRASEIVHRWVGKPLRPGGGR